jgi:hypothetical protein
MPEAAVHKHRHFSAWPSEIRTSRNAPMFSVTAKSACPQKLAQNHLSGFIPLGVNGGHDFGSSFFAHVIHKHPRVNYFLAYAAKSVTLMESAGTRR